MEGLDAGVDLLGYWYIGLNSPSMLNARWSDRLPDHGGTFVLSDTSKCLLFFYNNSEPAV